MKVPIGIYIGATVAVVASAFVVFGTFSAPTTESVQRGYRGNGMDLIYHRADLIRLDKVNQPPEAIPKSDPAGQKASTVYQNLKVLGDVDVSEFNRLMASMAAWIAPTQSCNYCHSADGNFASDDLYPKRVARRMLQMTRHINADWQKHVGQTGVTCWTCHRGQPVPAYVWYENTGVGSGIAIASDNSSDAPLSRNPFASYLDKANEIRVASNEVLPGGYRQTMQDTEATYALMNHFSNALGVNCTFCHNTRVFNSWEQSSPQRKVAWYGIRMVRDLNQNYLAGLKDILPQARLGAHGESPKINCLTCHQGVSKPVLGARMAEQYPELLATNDVASVKQEDKKPDEQKKPEEKKPDEPKK